MDPTVTAFLKMTVGRGKTTVNIQEFLWFDEIGWMKSPKESNEKISWLNQSSYQILVELININ